MLHFGLEGYLIYALYFGGIATFLASVFWRPSIGLYLLVFTLPLQTGRYRLHGMPLGGQLIDILLLGVLIGLFVQGSKVKFKVPLAGFLLFFASFYYVSLWQGAFYLDGPLPLSIADERFSDWKNYVELFLLYVVVASVIKDKTQVKLLLLVMAFSVLLVNRSYYYTISTRDLSHYVDAGRYAGALGYAGVNGFAAFEVMMSSFFIGIAVYVRRLPVKLGILALVATSAYCLLFSFSRAGYLGFLAALLVLGLLKERKLLFVVAIVLIAWQTVLPVSVRERIAMTTEGTGISQQLDPAAQDRLQLWEDAGGLFRESPIIGAGFYTYGFLRRVGPFRDTHNYYVKVVVETGILGLLLFLWLLGRMWGMGYSLFRLAQDPFWAAIGLGFVALICGVTVLNFFGDRWTYQQVTGYLWVLLGCVARGLFIMRQSDELGGEIKREALPSEMPSEVITA